MNETLTTAVIVLAICLIGLALLYSVLLSDHSRRIERIRKDTFAMEQAHRGNYSRLSILEKRLDHAIQDIDLNGIDRAINDIAGKVEKHENAFKALTSVGRVARWRAFNKFNIMREDERQCCEYCLSEDIEFDTKYIDIAGSTAPDRLVSQCCKCGQKSTVWRFEDEDRP